MGFTISDYKEKFKRSGYILLSPSEIEIIDRYINSVFDAVEDEAVFRAEVGEDLAVVLSVIFELNGKENSGL